MFGSFRAVQLIFSVVNLYCSAFSKFYINKRAGGFSMRIHMLACAVLFAVILFGCSNRNPVEPPLPSATSPIVQNELVNHHLLGYWQVRIDTDSLTAIMVPNRAAEMHLNCVRLLEVAPCTDCLKLENIQLQAGNIIQCNLVLRHPYSTGNLKLSGFDARAIFIGEADYMWPVSGRMMAVGDSVPRMLNPDGYTSLFNPTEFPQTTPAALGYIPGNYTFGGDLTATLNPYVAFNKDEPRRVFRFATTSTETIRVQFPEGPLEFGYALEGCWQTFAGQCTDPVEDFPPDANCLEAYEVTTWSGPGLSLDPGAWSYVYATVYDYQGLNTIADVTAEIPDVMAGQVLMDYYDTREDGGHVYRGMVTNDLGAGTGDYPFLVRVADTVADQNLGQIDAWCPGIFPVREGWVYMLGEEWSGYTCDIEINEFNEIFIIGSSWDQLDCDPSPGESYGGEEVNTGLVKFDWGGGYEWSARWETNTTSSYYMLDIDINGNIYILGLFSETTDFDPGPGVCERTSFYDEDEGHYRGNMFLLKLGSNGEFIWVQTWVNDLYIRPRELVVDDGGYVYLTGNFEGTQDFDPGIDEDVHECMDNSDAFIVKLGTDGSYSWAVTWGGIPRVRSQDIVIDGNGNVIVCGGFDGVVDMDPGPGEDWHDSEEVSACFFSKFDPDGNFKWSRSLTALSNSNTSDSPFLGVDADNCIYITSSFKLVVDFDPGPGLDLRISSGGWDAFLTKYDPDGNYQWVLTWGGEGSERVNYMTVDSFDNFYIGGRFRDTVDFDPGPGIEERTPAESYGWFLSKFNSDYGFEWVAAWDMDMGHEIASDSSGNVYLAYRYHTNDGPVDLDPGPTEWYLDTELYPNSYHAYILKMPYDFYWW